MKKLSLIFAIVLSLCFLTACAPDNTAEFEAQIATLEAQIEKLENTMNEQKEEFSKQKGTTNALIGTLADRVNAQQDRIDQLEAKTVAQEKTITNLENESASLEDKINKQEVKTSKKTLHLYNYNQYLSFNITYSELQHLSNYTAVGGSSKSYYSCKMTITTHASQPGISFEKVSIQYDLFDVGLGHVWFNMVTPPTASLSYDGFSEVSLYLTTSVDPKEYCFPPHWDAVSISSVSGSVIINE